MEYIKYDSKIFLRIDKGEEIIACIKKLAHAENIGLATLSGIGAVSNATIGIFMQDTKEYRTQNMSGSMEIVNLSGNVSLKNGEPYIHAHVTLTDSGYRAHGGHLNSAIVGATAELVLDCSDGAIDRTFSEEVGLNLMRF